MCTARCTASFVEEVVNYLLSNTFLLPVPERDEEQATAEYPPGIESAGYLDRQGRAGQVGLVSLRVGQLFRLRRMYSLPSCTGQQILRPPSENETSFGSKAAYAVRRSTRSAAACSQPSWVGTRYLGGL